MALTDAQVVILYFFRIAIVCFNKVMSEILVQLGDYGVIFHRKKLALFVIVLEYETVKSFTLHVLKNVTKHLCFLNFQIYFYCANYL